MGALMSIGPIENLVLPADEPALSVLMGRPVHGPIEFATVPGKWLVDRTPARDYFTGRFHVSARRVFGDDRDAGQGALAAAQR